MICPNCGQEVPGSVCVYCGEFIRRYRNEPFDKLIAEYMYEGKVVRLYGKSSSRGGGILSWPRRDIECDSPSVLPGMGKDQEEGSAGTQETE